jgi:hypothetical protein
MLLSTLLAAHMRQTNNIIDVWEGTFPRERLLLHIVPGVTRGAYSKDYLLTSDGRDITFKEGG